MDLRVEHVTVAGNRLAVHRAGRGPAAVLVHGWLCDSRDLVPLARELSVDHEVALVDLRGHGQSAGTPDAPDERDGPGGAGRFGLPQFAADVIGVVEQLGLAPAVLAGHSMGAAVVLEAAHARPDLASGVLLIDSRWALTAPSDEQVAGVPALWGDGFAARRDVIATARRQVLPGVSGELPVQEVAAQSSRSLLTWDGRRSFRECPVPVHALVTDQHALLIAAARDSFPSLPVEHIAGTGHWVQVEQPAAVADALRRFESRLGVGAPRAS